MIEIAGYSSNTLSKEADQKVSEERAAVVAQYLREVKDIPMRRILVPVGYGATHPAVSNKDPYDRELNRHVDIKVLVNQSLGQGNPRGIRGGDCQDAAGATALLVETDGR
jgi:outer membrane protein OmpA-like peptidoglycan-associated protein